MVKVQTNHCGRRAWTCINTPARQHASILEISMRRTESAINVVADPLSSIDPGAVSLYGAFFIALSVCLFAPLAWSETDLLDAEIGPDLSQTDQRSWQVDAEQQIEARQFDNARLLLENGIETLEDEHNRYHSDLVAPLETLGDVHYLLGNFPDAAESYQRAIHISRVNAGLHAPDQIPIVHKEARTYTAMGDLARANEREEYAYNLGLRAFGAYDPRLLKGLFHLADWYEQTNNIFAARGLYQHAVHVIDSQLNEQDPAMIAALRGLARSYRLERFPPIYIGDSGDVASFTGRAVANPTRPTVVVVNNFSAGEETLQRIVRLRREAQEPDDVLIAEAILDLADWYLLFKKNSRAHDLYQHAFNMIEAVEAVDASTFFAEPKLLHYPRPRNPELNPVRQDQTPSKGHVRLSFDVSPYGLISNVKTVSSVPANLMDFRVRRSMRYARYRPAVVNGQAVEFTGHEYLWEFNYLPDPGAAAPRPAQEPAPTQQPEPSPEGGDETLIGQRETRQQGIGPRDVNSEAATVELQQR